MPDAGERNSGPQEEAIALHDYDYDYDYDVHGPCPSHVLVKYVSSLLLRATATFIMCSWSRRHGSSVAHAFLEQRDIYALKI